MMKAQLNSPRSYRNEKIYATDFNYDDQDLCTGQSSMYFEAPFTPSQGNLNFYTTQTNFDK